MKDSITTYSKVHFTPLDPKLEDILIEDIAHALSLMTRANGHFSEFYSVAQHCIACCEEAIQRGYSNVVALACLLHDASEAYLADITRPIKKSLISYLEIEEKLQNAIYKKYIKRALTEEEQYLLSLVDDALLYNEFTHYMGEELNLKDTKLVSTPEFKFVDFKKVEDRYKELFFTLIEKCGEEFKVTV